MSSFGFMDFLAVTFSGLSLVAFGFALGCRSMWRKFDQAMREEEEQDMRCFVDDNILH